MSRGWGQNNQIGSGFGNFTGPEHQYLSCSRCSFGPKLFKGFWANNGVCGKCNFNIDYERKCDERIQAEKLKQKSQEQQRQRQLIYNIKYAQSEREKQLLQKTVKSKDDKIRELQKQLKAVKKQSQSTGNKSKEQPKSSTLNELQELKKKLIEKEKQVAALKRVNQEKGICKICMDKIATHSNQCGHLCVCHGCSLGIERCPLCRGQGRFREIFSSRIPK